GRRSTRLRAKSASPLPSPTRGRRPPDSGRCLCRRCPDRAAPAALRREKGFEMKLDPESPGSDIQQRLTRLESIEAIKQLQVEYAAACDAGLDAERIARLFAEDGVWEGGSPPSQFVGRAAVRQHFVDAKSFVRWTFHLMIGPQIQIHEGG